MKDFLQKQRGITLLELLISMSLGLVLLIGLLSLYVSNKKTYQYTQALARIQENGRIALAILSRDVRMAGYVGCSRLTDINLNTNTFATTNSLTGWHGGKTSTNMQLPIPSQKFKPETDVLLIQSAEAKSVAVKGTTQEKIYFSEAHNFSNQDTLLISDCKSGEIFQLNKPLLQKKYSDNAQVSRWQKIIYYIADTNRPNKLGRPIYALYRRDLNAAATIPSELISGVEDMQMSYAEIINNESRIKYVSAEQVKNWQAVRSVKINLLLASESGVNDRPQTYFFNGKKYHAKDHRLYKAWQTVVMLRERNN